MPKKHKTAVITSLDKVPEGYVQISQMFPDGTPRAKHWRRILSDAHAEGHIRAVKLFRTVDDAKTGPVFVDREAALEYIGNYGRRSGHAFATSGAGSDRKTELECLLTIEATLASILDVLRDQAHDTDSPRWHPNDTEEVGS